MDLFSKKLIVFSNCADLDHPALIAETTEKRPQPGPGFRVGQVQVVQRINQQVIEPALPDIGTQTVFLNAPAYDPVKIINVQSPDLLSRGWDGNSQDTQEKNKLLHAANIIHF